MSKRAYLVPTIHYGHIDTTTLQSRNHHHQSIIIYNYTNVTNFKPCREELLWLFVQRVQPWSRGGIGTNLLPCWGCSRHFPTFSSVRQRKKFNASRGGCALGRPAGSAMGVGAANSVIIASHQLHPLHAELAMSN